MRTGAATCCCPGPATSTTWPGGSRHIGGRVTLHLLSLATGTDHPIAVPLDPGWVGPGQLAWSPDSRWLFVITAHGGVAALNPGTLHVEGLGIRLPWLSQIAIRTAPAKSAGVA